MSDYTELEHIIDTGFENRSKYNPDNTPEIRIYGRRRRWLPPN